MLFYYLDFIICILLCVFYYNNSLNLCEYKNYYKLFLFIMNTTNTTNKESYFHNSIFNLYLAPSQIPDAGLGVYTKDFISAGSYIDEYTGDIYSFNTTSFYVLEVEPNYYIDAINYPRCYMGMINDCNFISKKIIKKKKRKINITPDAYYDTFNNKLVINCEFKKNLDEKRTFIYSIIDIMPNTELFISYGPNYWI